MPSKKEWVDKLYPLLKCTYTRTQVGKMDKETLLMYWMTALDGAKKKQIPLRFYKDVVDPDRAKELYAGKNRRNPDEQVQALERAVRSNLGDIDAWQALVHARMRIGDPLLATFLAARGLSEWKRRWITVEVHDIRASSYKYLHVLPRGFPWSQYTSYKKIYEPEPHFSDRENRNEEPTWSNSSLLGAEGLHLGPMTPEEQADNWERRDIQEEMRSHYEDTGW